MSDDLVTIAVFGSPFEAGLAKSELEAFGIPAFIADEFTVGANPLYSNALGGVKLKVPASHEQEARDILSQQVSSEIEKFDPEEPIKSSHKTMAKTFVWLYLLFGLIALAFVMFVATHFNR
jgi:hypothetical protein